MKKLIDQLKFYAVTDSRWLGEQTLYQQVQAALEGGVTCVQLREKHMDKMKLLQIAQEIHQLCQSYQVPFIMNDYVDLAIACKAEGIHVGQKDMQAMQVRAQIPKDCLLGVSVQTVEQAKLAQAQGADYLGVGTIFPTTTKTDAVTVSKQTLTAICQAVQIPVVAIGGIEQNNIQQLAGTGIVGVALVSSIFAQEDITQSCIQLKKEIWRHL
ncbi:MAG TPA: thiamine phosphate synthase [Enterococcus columbae]|nr:thiamine phosphate synthase [Enterococcus columbae]